MPFRIDGHNALIILYLQDKEHITEHLGMGSQKVDIY